jgi:hypothetical protein
MTVSKIDRLYYDRAVEYVVEQLEITHSFVKYNGLTSFSSEDVSNLAILHVKNWLTSPSGADWLATLGYTRTSRSGISNSSAVWQNTNGIAASGVNLTLADYCPVCSGIYLPADGTVCECCGRSICKPCSTVVDKLYGVEWCESCLQRESLTNMLSHNE